MRLAVVMAGQPRTLARLQEFHVSWLNELRQSHHVDAFLHGWVDPAVEDGARDQAIKRIGFEMADLEAEPDVPESHLFKPTTTGGGDPGGVGRVRNFALMWRSIQRSFDLARVAEEQNGFAYDWIVRARPDALWDPAAEVRAAIESDCNRFPRRLAARVEPSDLAFVAARDSAQAICDLYGNIPSFRPAYEAYGYRSFVPEFALGFYLRQRAVRWLQFDTDLVLLRDSGERVWFRQDSSTFAFQATRSYGSLAGDGLPENDATRVDRLRVDVQSNLQCSERDAEALARWVETVGIDLSDTRTRVIERVISGLDPSRIWAPSLLNVFVAGLLVECLRVLPAHQAAMALVRRPVLTTAAIVVLVRIRFNRRRREAPLLRRLAKGAQ